MSKLITTVSIDVELFKQFNSRFPNRNFSKFVEDNIKKELGDIVSIPELQQKIMDTSDNLFFLNDKYEEVIKMRLQSIEMKNIEEKTQLEEKLKEKQIEIQSLLNKTKDIPEIIEIINEVRVDVNKITDTKYIISKVDLLRQKYPAIRIGVFQLRTILSKLV